MRRKRTAGARGSGAGAAITRPARKPRASKATRPAGRDISLAGVFSVPWIRVYIRTQHVLIPAGTFTPRNLRGITAYGLVSVR